MKDYLKRTLQRIGRVTFPYQNHTNDVTTRMLLGKQLSFLQSGKSISNIAECEFKVFSQWGEDGIIDWLVNSLPSIPQTFIEFGVENYTEANTLFLLMNRNWRGLVIDGSIDNILQIKNRDIYWKFDLTARAEFITRDNISSIIGENGFIGEIGILSIDIDGNDYWVWEAINNISPAIVVCEYNATFGDIHPLSIPYMDGFMRHKLHYSGLYCGASLPALVYLGKKKGYALIGTNSSGVNVFFIRNDFLPEIMKKLSKVVSFPAKCSDSRNKDGVLTFLKRSQKIEPIKDMPLVNVITGETFLIKDILEFYSEDWKKIVGYV